MGENKILTDLALSDSTVHATINAPFDQVDLADWLSNLSDEEYQRCAPGEHKACAHGITEDGRPETLNVEMIDDVAWTRQSTSHPSRFSGSRRYIGYSSTRCRHRGSTVWSHYRLRVVRWRSAGARRSGIAKDRKSVKG
jgi:hypothetical protein